LAAAELFLAGMRGYRGSARDAGAELVAVQYNSMRLVVHPPPPDMRGRGMTQEFFLHGVLVNPAMVHGAG